MTNTEKLLIAQQLKHGLGYTDIAKKLGMSVNTVKSYCQRNGLRRSRSTAAPKQVDTVCRQCGSALIHTPGRKKKKFCSDTCRMRWWHAHRELGRNARAARCQTCGKEFVTDRAQKYCSHPCYISARFGFYTTSNAVSECSNTQIS